MADVPRDDDLPLSEEELLAFEISEDNRLRSIGINPDGDPVAIMAELRRRQADRKALADDGGD